MNHQDLFKLLRTVHHNVRCPQCGRQYTFSDIKIRGIVESICFLELHCREHMPLIATVVIENISERFIHNEPIKSDDVIETHKFLKGFHGGFKEIFKQK